MTNKEQEELTRLRIALVDSIRDHGIKDEALLEAMKTVPRERFVLEAYQAYAYLDRPLPILAEQTISQPYIVAVMISALELKATDRVLEVGCGSGYAAAILSRMVKEVYAVERHDLLVDYARERLTDLGYLNVSICHTDGTLGWPEHAPYDAIIVSASGPIVPPSLQQQLAIGGKLIMPVGTDRFIQRLIRVTRQSEEKFVNEELEEVIFVPLIGAEGWEEDQVEPRFSRRRAQSNPEDENEPAP
jgi:protein-L-isoaspartate(D-aspartate) O-methyltransferase